MKNLITTVIAVFVFTLSVNAQNAQFETTNRYAELKPGFNYPQNRGNNEIAANYAATGKLPSGYYTQTAQQLCQAQAAADMWVKYDVAADINKEINGGHIANPVEVFIITPEGNIHSAAECGNHPISVQFYKNPVVIVNVTTQQVDLTKVYAGQTQTHTRLDQMDQRFDGVDENQAIIVDNQRAIADRMALNQVVILDKLDEIANSQLRIEKNARQSRNWSIAGAILSGVGATAASIDLFNGDGNTSQIIQNIRNTTNTTNTTTGGDTNTPTGPGPGENG
jgi:hypothetical protein